MRWVKVLRPYPGPGGRDFQPGDIYREHPAAVPVLVRVGKAILVQGPKQTKPIGPRETKPAGPKQNPGAKGANNPTRPNGLERAKSTGDLQTAALPAADQLLDRAPSSQEEGEMRGGEEESRQVHTLEIGGSNPPPAIDDMSRSELFAELEKRGEEVSKYTGTKHLRAQLREIVEGR